MANKRELQATRAAFLHYVMLDNGCITRGVCFDPEKCGCHAEVENAIRETVNVAKCDHDYVEGATANGRRVLRCVLCKATVHIIDKSNLR